MVMYIQDLSTQHLNGASLRSLLFTTEANLTVRLNIKYKSRKNNFSIVHLSVMIRLDIDLMFINLNSNANSLYQFLFFYFAFYFFKFIAHYLSKNRNQCVLKARK